MRSGFSDFDDRSTALGAKLFFGFVVSAIGAAYFVYGKRQTKFAALICGIALCVYPYFVDSWLALCTIGGALMAVPFFVDF